MKAVKHKGYSPFSKETMGDPSVSKGILVKSIYKGLPYKGTKKDLFIKEGDPESKKPKYTGDFKIKVFDMSSPDDIKEYNDIYNGVASSKYGIDIEKIEYDNKLQNWKILLRWVEPYYTDPIG